MKTEHEEILKKQKENWDELYLGWKKWDNISMKFLRPLADAILQTIDWDEKFIVLDIAAGSGEPGVSAANLVKKGKVFGTDLSEKMLSLASKKAELMGLENYETRVCSVYELPFENNYFDIVLCRLGFMFFPDILAAVTEIKRVLKPGGRISTCVWASPEKNFWATNMMGSIKKFIDIPPPSNPDAPGMFRCAQPGYISNFFEQAGLKNISEKSVDFTQDLDSFQLYWDLFTDMSSLDVLNNADNNTKEKIKSTACENSTKFLDETGLHLPSSAIIISAQK
jgi:SAM-dependent methyltransferase